MKKHILIAGSILVGVGIMNVIPVKNNEGEILKDNGAFLIIKLSVNPKNDNATLNTANVVLKTNKNKYTNTLKYYSYFKDLGAGYKNQVIKNNNTYLLVYEIKEEDISNNFYINYSGNVKDTKIDLSPINLDNNEKKYEYKIIYVGEKDCNGK